MIYSVLFLYTPFFPASNLTAMNAAYQLLIELRYLKLKSFMTMTDIVFYPQDHYLYFSNDSYCAVSDTLTLSSNREWLGFTTKLTTKYAGSLFINSAQSTFKITFPIGLGILKCYQL
tara:strand:+ start:116 stop:466 length:351 start_codon:yes stop_codon:yes gene_type:complete